MTVRFLFRRRALLTVVVEPLLSVLDLIRSRKVSANDLPTASMAQASCDYVKTATISMPVDEVGELAAALSSLILAKSRELTPWIGSETEEFVDAPLRDRQPIIHSFEVATVELGGRHARGHESFPRLDYVDGAARVRQPVPLPPFVLARAFEHKIHEMVTRGNARVPSPVYMRLEMAIQSLQDSLRQLKSFSLGGIIRRRSLDRRAAVVYFLAVLDLARKGLVSVSQQKPFEDIVLVSLPSTASPILGTE